MRDLLSQRARSFVGVLYKEIFRNRMSDTRRGLAVLVLILTLVMSLQQPASSQARNPIRHEPYGSTPDGKSVDLYTLTNRRGVELRVTNYGGIIVSLRVPDRNGK